MCAHPYAVGTGATGDQGLPVRGRGLRSSELVAAGYRFVKISKKFRLIFSECVHFRTNLFDSKCQLDLLILIAIQ